MTEGKKTEVDLVEKKRDANACIAIGAGVGALGTASALLATAFCPLCLFIAPGLIGIGAYQRWQLNKTESQLTR